MPIVACARAGLPETCPWKGAAHTAAAMNAHRGLREGRSPGDLPVARRAPDAAMDARCGLCAGKSPGDLSMERHTQGAAGVACARAGLPETRCCWLAPSLFAARSTYELGWQRDQSCLREHERLLVRAWGSLPEACLSCAIEATPIRASLALCRSWIGQCPRAHGLIPKLRVARGPHREIRVVDGKFRIASGPHGEFNVALGPSVSKAAQSPYREPSSAHLRAQPRPGTAALPGLSFPVLLPLR